MVGMWTWVAGHVCAQDVCTKGRVRAVPPQPCCAPHPRAQAVGFRPWLPPCGVFRGPVSTQAGHLAQPLGSRLGLLERVVVGICTMASELGCIFVLR